MSTNIIGIGLLIGEGDGYHGNAALSIPENNIKNHR